MKFNSYNFTARLLPAILCIAPFFVLHYYYLEPTLGAFWGTALSTKIIANATLSLALLFLLIQINRFLSKRLLESRFFRDSSHSPTTELLLHSNHEFSDEYTQSIHKKIFKDFSIIIPPYRQELVNEGKSRKIIGEAVAQIRTRIKEGRLVGQHNSEYGFWRNLSGGSIFAVLVSLFDLILFKSKGSITAMNIAIALACIYAVIVLSSKALITHSGKNYARVLLQEYTEQS